MERIGKITRIMRYPVKSMRGEELATARLESYGMLGDRVYAFIDDQNRNPRFPWMTARNANEMLLFKPSFVTEKEVVVTSPEGKEYSITDSALERYFEEKYRFNMSLKYRESGCHDSMPVSLIGNHTITRLEDETGLSLAGERFRANIYVDWENQEPFYEDELLDRRIRLDGDVVLQIAKKDSRCVIPTLDPYSAEASPIVLQTIQKNYGGCFGVYADVDTPGQIFRGDEIFLL